MRLESILVSKFMTMRIKMAIYHKTLKYHEDQTQKRDLTQEDIQFLLELQKEMNTQDTTGTADPRYWVIKGSETYRNDLEPDEYGLLWDGTEPASTTEETIKYLNENILPHCGDLEKRELSIEPENPLCPSHEFVLNYKDFDGNEDYDYLTREELNEFLSENGYSEVEVIGISVRPVIYPSTMFLTEKAAREHLQRNDYHYSDDAHTYCMCSWRSPDVERLWKILREIRWEGARRVDLD